MCVTSDDLVGSSYGVRVQVLSAWPRFRHALCEGRFGECDFFFLRALVGLEGEEEPKNPKVWGWGATLFSESRSSPFLKK